MLECVVRDHTEEFQKGAQQNSICVMGLLSVNESLALISGIDLFKN